MDMCITDPVFHVLSPSQSLRQTGKTK